MSLLFFLDLVVQPYVVAFVPIRGHLRHSESIVLRDNSLDLGIPKAHNLVPDKAISLVTLWIKVCKVNSFGVQHVIGAIHHRVILSLSNTLLVNGIVIEARNELPLMFSHCDEAHKVALTEQGHDVEKVNLVV